MPYTVYKTSHFASILVSPCLCLRLFDMPVRRTLCNPVDPSDRHWVPHYDLDHIHIHPDVALLLSWYLPMYIDMHMRQARTEMKPMFGRATNELLRVFDFNRDFKYDFAAFAHELRVRSSISTESQYILTLPELRCRMVQSPQASPSRTKPS
jgi:hypothetical protein